MKGLRHWLALLGALGVALSAGVVPLFMGLRRAPDIEVRTVPWRTQAGQLGQTNRTGQGFRSRWDGLARIDVALVALAPAQDAQLELVLRAGSRAGEVLRSASVSRADPAGTRAWAAFEFEAIEDSGGREFWFQLGPAAGSSQVPSSPWIRYHGQAGVDAPWGDRIVPGRVFEGALIDNTLSANQLLYWGQVPHPHLAAVAFAVEELRQVNDEARLELWGEGSDPRRDPPLRSVLLEEGEEVLGGYAYFRFEPIAKSRWKRMRYRLTVPEGARVVGFESGLSFKTFHGGTPGPPALLGLTRGGRLQLDRSLVFRAHSTPARAQVFEAMAERAGWRLWAGALAWLLSTLLALRLVLPARS